MYLILCGVLLALYLTGVISGTTLVIGVSVLAILGIIVLVVQRTRMQRNRLKLNSSFSYTHGRFLIDPGNIVDV